MTCRPFCIWLQSTWAPGPFMHMSSPPSRTDCPSWPRAHSWLCAFGSLVYTLSTPLHPRSFYLSARSQLRCHSLCEASLSVASWQSLCEVGRALLYDSCDMGLWCVFHPDVSLPLLETRGPVAVLRPHLPSLLSCTEHRCSEMFAEWSKGWWIWPMSLYDPDQDVTLEKEERCPGDCKTWQVAS